MPQYRSFLKKHRIPQGDVKILVLIQKFSFFIGTKEESIRKPNNRSHAAHFKLGFPILSVASLPRILRLKIFPYCLGSEGAA